MKNIYYLLWVDAIVNSKDYKNKQEGWKSYVFWTITTINVFNILLVLFWLDFYHIYRHKFLFNFSKDSFVLGLLEGFLNVFLPFSIINYFLIFYNDRYKKLIKKYSHYNGKFMLVYSLGSIFLIVLTVIIMW